MIDNKHKLTQRKNKRGAAILLLAAIAAISFACLLIDDAPTHSTDNRRALLSKGGEGGASLSVCPTTIHPEWGAIKPIKWYPPLPDDSWFLWRRMIHIPPPYQFILANLHESMLRDPTRILRIVVLGGSMTAGAACKQGNAYNKNCAWGHRLEFQLQSYFGENRVEVTNLARGGTQSEVALGSLYSLLGAIEQKPDILISDYSVNDMYEFGGNTGHTSAIRRDEDDYEKAVRIIISNYLFVIDQVVP